MLCPMYAVRDSLTGFMTPTVDANDASAMRGFQHAVKATRDVMHTYPEDFSLYRIGAFDTDTGVLHPESPGPVLICHGKDGVSDV